MYFDIFILCISADPSLQQGERVREHLPRGRRQEAFYPRGRLLLRAGGCSWHSSFRPFRKRRFRPSDRAAARSLLSFTAMLLKRGKGCGCPWHHSSWTGQKFNVRPSDRAATRSLPSFTAILLKRAEGSIFLSWRLLSVLFF